MLDLRLRWRQTGEVKRHAPQPDMRFGLGTRLKARCLLLGKNKGVHPIQRPALITHGGWRGIPHRLIGPMLAPFLDIHAGFFHRFRHRHRLTRIGRTALHPLLQHGDLTLWQFRLRRHLHIRVRVAHRLDEVALFQRPRH